MINSPVATLLRMGLACLACSVVDGWTEPPVPSAEERLAVELSLQLAREGDVRSSAIEFRRLGRSVEDAESEAGYFWAAAHQYWMINEYRIAERLLDRAEDVWPPVVDRALLLRGESSMARQNYGEAVFYWNSLVRGAPDDEPDQEVYARRRLATTHLRRGRTDEARRALKESPAPEKDAIRSLQAYEAGRDKNPTLGGWLGVIPGMGYVYAGEYANAFRSLLLNAIFIYGMVDTAQNNHWGGFAVITFFEVTWFTGSIYGGIDASHRYNRERLERTIEEIEGEARFTPQWDHLPAISLRFTF